MPGSGAPSSSRCSKNCKAGRRRRWWSSTRPTWPARPPRSSSGWIAPASPASRPWRPPAAASLELREALIRAAPEEFLRPPAIVADLVPPGELAVLVVPIDLEAPKGRLIVPQVQTIRDLLDGDAYCLVVKERELRDALERLTRPPALVVTDSQAFLKVAGDTPPGVKMTSFSILFARQKGDLGQFVEGALAIDRLQSGDRVLVAEACTHHPIGDDIGRVKIPRWLRQYVGGKLQITHHRRPRFSRRPGPVSAGGPLRGLHVEPPRDAHADVALPDGGRADLQLRHDDRLHAGHLRPRLEPFPDALETYRRLSAKKFLAGRGDAEERIVGWVERSEPRRQTADRGT